MQGKVLRAVQEGEIRPVGGKDIIKVDVRILSASNRDLDRMRDEGTFREDLYYRINVITIHVPSLRERRGDIELLANHFCARFNEKNRKTFRGLTPETLDLLRRHHWPGNVRELENAVERAVLLADAETLTPVDFGMVEDAPRRAPVSTLKQASRVAAAETERRMILAALDLTEGNVTRAAARLGLSRRGLQLKMKELELR